MLRNYALSKSNIALLFCLSALLFGVGAQSQVVKPFLQRSSQYTPEKKIYNIKGDFTMIGNTNMTLQNYGNQTQNGNNVMQYVDVDAASMNGLGGLPTFNSSSATLTLSTENGAIPECSNIIFAGLYWTGRAANAAPSQMQFPVTKEIVTGSTPFSNNYAALMHNQNVTGTSYNLTVSRTGTANNYSPRYTFSGGGNLYQFNFTNTASNMVSVSVNGGSATFIPVTVSTVGFVKTATLTTPYTFTTGGLSVTINQLIRDSRTDRSVVETQAASKVNLNVSGVTSNTTSYTKNFDKRKIQFRGPGAAQYTEITANNNDIFYPEDSNDYMYSAYAEVTDYVRTHGLGEYFTADMALTEGNGGGTGLYGGWGLIVIYENTKMKYRDVTLFDGYAYVIGGTASNLLPISGFNTVQTGPVGLKLGVIAGEGDRDITGDYFQIQRQSDGVFENLNHTANTPDNFFNSSVQTEGPRNPNLLNNTGLDLDMFTVPNPDNSVITNNQTSTTFKYGSIQDTYIIFAMAMAVDAYIPEIEGELSAVSINGVPAGTGPYSVEPGQEMEFRIKVRNRGTEPLTDAKLVVPIPFNTEYVAGSAANAIFFNPLPTPNTLSFDPAQGSNGSLVWDIGSLPLPESPEAVLGELVFKLTVTEDCNLLQQNCTNIIQVNGSVSAKGEITGIAVNNLNLILGYEADGNCQGNALPAPLGITLNATEFINANCQGVPEPVSFTFCTPETNIPITEIVGSFPAGSTFYNEYPVTSESIQYNINNPFPATPGTTTYYAIPPQGQGCFFAFTITVNSVSAVPVVSAPDVTYCVGAVASPLTATASDPSHTLYYFNSPNGTPQLSITPSTAVAGVFIYYVAEGTSFDCYGPKAEITVTVVPGFTITPPADASFEGCGTDAITGLGFSETAVAITTEQFIAAGGSVSNAELAAGEVITYSDVRSGNCPIIITRTFSINGECGQQSVTQQITVEDLTAPTLSALPVPTTVNGCEATPDFVTPTATDNCEGAITLTFVDETAQQGCETTVTRTWTATDLCGNPATASQSITFIDNTPPVFEALPAPSTIGCGESPVFATPVVSDSCSADVTLTFIDSEAPGTCEGSVIFTRTWTANDGCQNTASAQQIITRIDEQAPVISTPAQNLTIECSADDASAQINEWLAQNGGAVATDACSSITWTNNFTAAPTDCSAAVTVIFTATDGCGNAISTEAQILINDTTAPALPTAPENIVLTCTDAIPSGQPLTAVDTCSGEISANPVDTEVAGECPGTTIITRTWTFTDGCENSASVTQIITVNDTTSPEFTFVPEAQTIECGTEPIFGTPVATDTCSAEVTITFADETTNGACEGSTIVTRTWTATDACNNQSTASQIITLLDTTAPTITTPASNIEITCTTGSDALATWLANNGGATATDACSTVTWTNDYNGQTGACGTAVSVTFTATDGCDNEVTTSASFTIIDTEAPVAPTAPEAVTVSCAGDVPVAPTLVAQDACAGEVSATGVDVITPGTCVNNYTIVRTWTFVDDCDNSVSITQNITVDDTTPPVAPDVPADVTVSCASLVPVGPTLIAIDGCGSVEISATPSDSITPGDCPNSYVITRTWSFADACKNGVSVSQTITVNDTEAPVFTTEIPQDVALNCEEIPSAPAIFGTDNCNTTPIEATLAETTTPGSCAGNYTLVRTWTLTDACNNSATATQTITVQDTTGPVAQDVPASVTLECGSEVPAGSPLVAIDACSGESVTANPVDVTTPGSCANSFTVTRTWTFTDACNNTSTATQTITIEDTQAPAFTMDLAGEITVNCGEVPEAPVLTAVDACSNTEIAAVFTETSIAGICPEINTITRTWTATDACNNSVSMTQIIHVTDTAAPVLETPFDEVVNVGCGEEIPPVPELVFSDACSELGATLYSESATEPVNGSYTITRNWTASDSCNNQSSFTQTINVTSSGTPTPASAYAVCNTDSTLILDLTESLPDGTPAGGTFVDVDNSGGLQGSSFAPNTLATGIYTVDYVTGDSVCPSVVRIEVTVDDDCLVLEECEPFVHNAFSPNGDGKNDIFVIQNFDNTECIIDNRVQIFNRWGILVFDMDKYDNQTRAFRGYSDGRTTVKKDDALPAGTYFYIINYTKFDGSQATKDGYLYLSR